MAQEETADSARVRYSTPSIPELQRLLWTDRRPPGPVNQVWPDLHLGDEASARDKPSLSQLGVTHIVNAAAGPRRINTGPQFYSDMDIQYCGVEAADHPTFHLRPFFLPTAEFIQTALAQKALTPPRGQCADAGRYTEGSSQESFEESAAERMTSSSTKNGKKLNAYAAVKADPNSDYATPGAFDLEKMFWQGSGAAYAHVNEVWPNTFLGDEKTALERENLEKMGVTHILNAAEGKWNNVATGPKYYSDMNVEYYGVVAEDIPTFSLSQFFYPAAQFMERALSKPQNKLLVHCVMGRSRSATLLLAYLMIHRGMTVVEAIEHVKERRCILPNRGFLKQLRQLDIQLQQQRHGPQNHQNGDGPQNHQNSDGTARDRQ